MSTPQRIKQDIEFVSLSMDTSEPIGAAIGVVSILALDINGNDVSEFRPSFAQWMPAASAFARKYGFDTQLKAVARRFTKKVDLFGDDEDVVALGKAIVKARTLMRGNLKLDEDALKLLHAGGRILVKDTETGWNYLVKHISLIRDPRLTATYLPVEDEADASAVPPSEASKQMTKLYEKITGQRPIYGFFIAPSEMPGLVKSKPDLMAEYSALAKVLRTECKRLVFRYVRNSGKEMVPVDEVSKYLDKTGLLHNLPRGFIGGQVDEAMNFYTSAGNKLQRAPVGLVRMNKKYDPVSDNTYVLYMEGYGKGTRGNGDLSAGRVRTIGFVKGKKAVRHAKVAQFLEIEDRCRAKWVADMKRIGTKEQVLGCMVELLYVTSARIGGKGNKTAGEPTYGLTTLQVSHVKLEKNELRFDYVGKKMAPQPARYKLATPEGKLVKAVIEKLLEDKSGTDLVFEFRGAPILRHTVSKYIKQVTGLDLSNHDFRRITGTKMAMGIIAKNPFTARAKKGQPIKESEVRKWLDAELVEIGAALNHRNGEKVTGSVAIKSYIDPEVLLKFYDSLGMRPANAIPK